MFLIKRDPTGEILAEAVSHEDARQLSKGFECALYIVDADQPTIALSHRKRQTERTLVVDRMMAVEEDALAAFEELSS